MRIETALRKRDELKTALCDVYMTAQHSCMTHDKLCDYVNERFAKYSNCPQWVIYFNKGVYSMLRDILYRDHLEYCSVAPNGEILSHDSRSDRYYQKRGFTPAQWANTIKVGGHYWRNTDKPFYVKES